MFVSICPATEVEAHELEDEKGENTGHFESPNAGREQQSPIAFPEGDHYEEHHVEDRVIRLKSDEHLQVQT